jgi:hypothetical protein
VVKRRVEDGHLRHAGAQHRARRRDAAEIVRIVKRRELDEILELAPELVVDTGRLREPLSPVHDSVPDRLDLGDARDRDARLVAGHPLDDVFHGGSVIANRRRRLDGRAPLDAERQDRLPADALDLAAREATVAVVDDRVAFGGGELEFESGGADVEDEDVHIC